MSCVIFGILLTSLQPGDKIKVNYASADGIKEKEIIAGKKEERSFAISQIPGPTPLQSAILKSWLGE